MHFEAVSEFKLVLVARLACQDVPKTAGRAWPQRASPAAKQLRSTCNVLLDRDHIVSVNPPSGVSVVPVM